MAGFSGWRFKLVSTVVVIYWNSLSFMKGILHTVDVQWLVSLTAKGWTFTFANDVPPTKNDAIMLRRYADEHKLKHGFRKIHTYYSILKIMLELIDKPQ